MSRDRQPLLFDAEENILSFEGLQATFVPSKNEPLHSWFSPEFVEAVHTRFMPDAKRIVDPFAGTGTTPLVLAARGIECGYCEVNPVMQEVIQTKLAVAGLPGNTRQTLALQIRRLADTFGDMVRLSHPDAMLERAYSECFGESEFFGPKAFDLVLRSRSLCDELSAKDQLLGRILELAIISNLVVCSRLKRAGDVRYKTPAEVERGTPDLVHAVASQLENMALDTSECPQALANPVLLTPNAKNLRAIPKYGAGGVITSPPYLNGTNYIRNTKLELWYSRKIIAANDLRRIRDHVVTAGINDVTSAKGCRSVTPGVADLVEQMRKAAYDQRIPKMVAAYFEDMLAVFIGLWAQTRPGAIVCIDIGDSRYGGVHVPTHSWLRLPRQRAYSSERECRCVLVCQKTALR